MAVGPGKYDDLATYVREKAEAKGVVLIVIGGPEGPGFSVQGDLATMVMLPSMLRAMADQIEADLHSPSEDGRP